MRQTYPTEGIVIGRRPLGEESILVTLITREAGLVYARAQGLRKPGAKLASALATFAESDIILVAGREGWRVTGALLRDNWFRALSRPARTRASRVATLLLRLVPGETIEERLYDAFAGYLRALIEAPEDTHEALECLAVLHILASLGLDAGELPGTDGALYTQDALREVGARRTAFITRANSGIAASGL